MDSMLHFKAGDTWLLSRGMRARHHLSPQAQAPREAALPVFARWRGLDSIAPVLLEKLRQSRADHAYVRRLDDLQLNLAYAERQLPLLAARQPWQVSSAGPVLGGDGMLASWHLLFQVGGIELAGPGPLGREFATYACHVSACTRRLHDTLACFEQLAQQATTAARHSVLAELAERMLAWATPWWTTKPRTK